VFFFNVAYQVIFFVFPEMVYGSVDNNAFHPAHQRGFKVFVAGLKLWQRAEYFKKPIVCHLHRIIVGITIAHTNTHSKTIVELIKLFLALPVCSNATLDNIFELLPVWQNFLLLLLVLFPGFLCWFA
jgi:hypothetical protein